MDRLTTFSTNSVVPSATLNAMQDRAVGMRLTTQAAASELTAMAAVTGGGAGLECRLWASDASGVAAADLLLIDDSADWRDRLVFVWWQNIGAANVRAAQANDYTNDGTLVVVNTRMGYLGTGGKDAGGASPSAGNPPVTAAGKYRVEIATNVSLYADASNGKLYIYNANGAAIFGFLRIDATPDLAKR